MECGPSVRKWHVAVLSPHTCTQDTQGNVADWEEWRQASSLVLRSIAQLTAQIVGARVRLVNAMDSRICFFWAPRNLIERWQGGNKQKSCRMLECVHFCSHEIKAPLRTGTLS